MKISSLSKLALGISLSLVAATAFADDFAGLIRLKPIYPLTGFPSEARMVVSPRFDHVRQEKVFISVNGGWQDRLVGYMSPLEYKCFMKTLAVLNAIPTDPTDSDDWYPQFNGYSTLDLFWMFNHGAIQNTLPVFPNLHRGLFSFMNFAPVIDDEYGLDGDMEQLHDYLVKNPQMRNDPRILQRWSDLWNSKQNFSGRMAGFERSGTGNSVTFGAMEANQSCVVPTLSEIRFSLEYEVTTRKVQPQHMGSWTPTAFGAGANPADASPPENGVKNYGWATSSD